jgi:hypothetical protein
MIKTNKEQLITLAVQGEIVPPQIVRTYQATWDGRAKLCIGVGGINYNLKTGMKIFGWANGDRAEPGVATDGLGNDSQKKGYREKTGIGNIVKVLNGEAKGETGTVTGKHGYRLPSRAHHILVHFNEEVLEKLAIGDKLQIKAKSVGLKIEDFDDVLVRSSSPELLEGMKMKVQAGKLIVPVAMRIPHILIGAGIGTRAHSSHIEIQTCYPPDIKEYGLDDLRFGDIVFLQDTLSDYGRHFYRGGSTVGVIVSGPSEISGQGIGVSTILSSKTGLMEPLISKEANLQNILKLE